LNDAETDGGDSRDACSFPLSESCVHAYRALRGLGIAKDILVWTRSEFEKRRHLKASLPSAILREGKLLHAA
jgi:hypothetical protein